MGSRSWTLSAHDAIAQEGDAAAAALDDIVFTSPSATVGTFRCPTWHPSFADSGPIQNDVFVFPRRSVGLCHEGQRPFLADPGMVTLYNQGQRYSRSAVSPVGDQCEWFAVEHELLLAAVGHHDPGIRDRPGRPFRYAYGPSRPRTYLAQRALFEGLRAGAALDSLRIEEAVVTLLSEVLSSVYAFWGPSLREPRASARQLEAAEHVRQFLAERLGEPLQLSDIARAVGMSAFHLCRTFRAATGSTLHAYRNQVRLREALERLAGGEDLTQIGLELGYSSHSHFTAAFRASFGLTPSSARSRLRGPSPRRSRQRGSATAAAAISERFGSPARHSR